MRTGPFPSRSVQLLIRRTPHTSGRFCRSEPRSAATAHRERARRRLRPAQDTRRNYQLHTGQATIFSNVPKGKVADVARMLKAIHAQEDRRSAEDKVREVAAKLRTLRLTKAAELVEAKAHETLTYFAFPSNHWRQIKTNNPLERIIREIRRRTRVVGAFPDGHSALMRVAARLLHIASTKWGNGVISRWKHCSTRFSKRQLLERSSYRRRKCERPLAQPE